MSKIEQLGGNYWRIGEGRFSYYLSRIRYYMLFRLMSLFGFDECDYTGFDFGADYEDSSCIKGKLYNLDNCDDNGNLYDDEDTPDCPHCAGTGFMRFPHERENNQTT